jgi:hypothetical protein
MNIETLQNINKLKNLNLNIKEVGYTTFLITTSSALSEEWFAEYTGRFFLLNHKNDRNNRNRYHKDKKFVYADDMLRYIFNHSKKIFKGLNLKYNL